MKEDTQPAGGLQDQDPLRKGLEDEEERKRLEKLRKALTERPRLPQSGLHDQIEED